MNNPYQICLNRSESKNNCAIRLSVSSNPILQTIILRCQYVIDCRKRAESLVDFFYGMFYTNNKFALLHLLKQAYHSTFPVDPQNDRMVGNFAILPLNSKYRGPAYPANSDYDIIDECLDLFRANSFFKNFEIKSPADRVLIYGILFINDCLSNLKPNTSYNEAMKVLTNVALDNFTIPGTPGFPLNTVYSVPVEDRNGMDLLKTYIQQFRQELAMRLLERIYRDSKESPSKYWLAFTRRRFMNKSL